MTISKYKVLKDGVKNLVIVCQPYNEQIRLGQNLKYLHFIQQIEILANVEYSRYSNKTQSTKQRELLNFKHCVTHIRALHKSLHTLFSSLINSLRILVYKIKRNGIFYNF